jgi:trehalose 6-phosphate phosphatase
MGELETGVGERARAVLACAGSHALFIDIDGTLLAIAPTPDAVQVPAGLVRLLDAVKHGLGGALAVLTGRPIADADRLLSPLAFAAGGVHGAELRLRPTEPVAMLAQRVPPEIVRAVGELGALAPGILVEDKGFSIAVHYRQAPLIQAVLEREMAAIVENSPLVMRRGRKVLEAVPACFDKGTALAALAASPPFKGRSPIMVGDDKGDEPAFLAAEQLGGVGLRVAGEHFSSQDADFADVGAVRAWLEALAARLASEA